MIGVAAILGGLLLAAGLYLLLSRDVQRVAIGFLLLSNAANVLVLTASGLPARADAPLLSGTRDGPFADPLPQAFILTAIVIGLGMAAFLLAMATRLYRETGRDDLDGGRAR